MVNAIDLPRPAADSSLIQNAMRNQPNRQEAPMTTTASIPTALPRQTAHVGVIVPAVNRVCERQFHAYAPPTLGVHTMRARIAGKWARPIEVMADEIKLAAQMLADCTPDLLVYNCTASSMREGPSGERRIIDLIRDATGIETISTSAVISEAFRALGITSVVVISPYPDNNEILGYLEQTGIKVARSVALNLPLIEYGATPPQRWREIARENDVAAADGIFLSCAATTQIEAVASIEADLGKPVVNSNQAVLWGALKRLAPKLGPRAPMPHLGSLMAR